MVKPTIKASLRAEELTFLPEPMFAVMEKRFHTFSFNKGDTCYVSN